MQYYYDAALDTDVPIDTLELRIDPESDGEDEYVKVSNMEDFEMLVKCMGWHDAKEFWDATSIHPRDLLNQWFMIVHNRVYYM